MFRNREIRQFAVCFAAIAMVTTMIGFTLQPMAGILSLASATAFGLAFFVLTKARYRRIAQMSEQIDRLLHNAEAVYVGGDDEGELAILQSEIIKMLLRIREQNGDLKKEKAHLADSLADIAHQLRTPLTSVHLVLSLLADDGNVNERKTLVREAEELLMRMEWLLSALLKLSRLDAGIVVFQYDEIPMKALIEDALRPFLILIEVHRIEIAVEVARDVMIWGDFAWLSEAMQNIIKNCLESVGENGKVALVCTDTPLFTELVIHDNGKGLAAEDLPRLFDRFYRARQTNGAGYGLGLALSKMIITRQNGLISAKNHPQGGAMFTIRFTK